MSDLTKIDKRLSVYFSAVSRLHCARKVSINGFSEDVMDSLVTVVGRKPGFNQGRSVMSQQSELDNSELVKLLQKSAVEHLTTYRQLVARDFGSVATIATTDFEALYAYKHGDYQRCLQLSTQNVHTLLYAVRMPDVPTLPEFIELLDNDTVSLTVLMLIVDPECRAASRYSCITQLTLSLHLMTQCRLKLRHSVTSQAQTLSFIKVAQRRQFSRERTLDHLTLKLIERKVSMTISP